MTVTLNQPDRLLFECSKDEMTYLRFERDGKNIYVASNREPELDAENQAVMVKWLAINGEDKP